MITPEILAYIFNVPIWFCKIQIEYLAIYSETDETFRTFT
jgi:hypothetical protein